MLGGGSALLGWFRSVLGVGVRVTDAGGLSRYLGLATADSISDGGEELDASGMPEEGGLGAAVKRVFHGVLG